MKKPLLKLYLTLAASLILTVVFLPMIVGRTAAWAQSTATHVELLAYQDDVLSAPDKDKGSVVIVMDDGWETQYTRGYEIMKSYGLKACIAVVPVMVGEEGYTDYQQLAEVYMDGWDLLNHTYNHANLAELSEDEQREQIAKARDWLHDNLFERGSDIVVYPQGSFSDGTIDILKEEGVIAARSLKSVWAADIDCTIEDAEVCNLISSISMERVGKAIDKAISNKSAVIFVLHKIEPVTDDTQMQLDEEKFREIIENIAGHRDELNVLTMTELLAAKS
ncbi:MAG: polysaccharide deacetylase family protein [Eubacteriales bacterium]|nr:polysaccharide deacetylase family protein [Eubacteriales bacterium]